MGFEIVNINGKMDYPFMPRFRHPFFPGIRVEVSADAAVMEQTYIMTHEKADLLSMAISCSRYEDKDKWNFFVNENQLAENIYTKELPEGLYFMVCVPLKKGDKLKFQFVNDSLTSKAVWVNYQLLVNKYIPKTVE